MSKLGFHQKMGAWTRYTGWDIIKKTENQRKNDDILQVVCIKCHYNDISMNH